MVYLVCLVIWSIWLVSFDRTHEIDETDQINQRDLPRSKISKHFPWVADHDRVRRHVAGHHRSGTDQGIFADDHIRQDGRPRSNRRPPLDQRDFDFPVLLGLESTGLARRTREGVIDECDIVPDKDLVLDRDPFTDERVARYLASPADFGILLNLNECSNVGLISNLATVEVDEF